MSEVSIEPLWLCWSNIGQRNLPPRLSLKNLRILELSELSQDHQFEELWEAESAAPVQLRELVISSCYKFQRLPNSIGRLTELKKIVICISDNIRSLPESFCRLQQLEHLKLCYTKLSSLPCRFGDLTNLRYLDLSLCFDLKSLPVSFRNLSLLQHLNLYRCRELILEPDDFQNITKLEFLDISWCEQLEELPHHITNQASLRELHLSGVKRLREVPIEINQLGRMQELDMGSDIMINLPNSLGGLSSLTHLWIGDCLNLESLPTSIGNLSSLTSLMIDNCPELGSLPISLGDLFSLTHLSIWNCPKLRSSPFSVGRLGLLENLEIKECPFIEVDFDMASSSSISSNLKRVELWKTGVCRISISQALERLELYENDQLTEVEAVPASLECLSIRGSPKLVVLPSFARLISLRKLLVQDCERIHEIEGLKDCTGLEYLTVETSEEVLGMESLEKMQNLRTLELRANKGSAISRCIQTIKRWPDGVMMCTRAVPDASSLLLNTSLLSPHVFIVDSLKFSLNLVGRSSSEPMKSLLKNSCIKGNAILLCFVINFDHSSQVAIELEGDATDRKYFISSMFVSKGRWAVIGVFTPRCTWLTGSLEIRLRAGKKSYGRFSWVQDVEDVELERSLGAWGEEQRVVEALLPLLQSIST